MTSTPYGHDPDDPLGQLNKLEACLLAIRLPDCPHCQVDHQAIPMGGNGWGVQSIHQEGCPTNELPTPQRPGG